MTTRLNLTIPVWQAEGRLQAWEAGLWGRHEPFKVSKLLFVGNGNIIIFPSSPLVNISASVGHGAYALGYQTAFDAGKCNQKHHSKKCHFVDICLMALFQASPPWPSTILLWPTTPVTWSSTAPPMTPRYIILCIGWYLFSHLRWLYSLRRAIRHKLCWDQQLWAELWLAYYHQHSNWVSRNIKSRHWLWLSYHDHLYWLWLQKLELNCANNSWQYLATSSQSNTFEKHIFKFPIQVSTFSIRINLHWKPYFLSSLAIRSWSLLEELFRPWDRHHPRYRWLCWKQVYFSATSAFGMIGGFGWSSFLDFK